MEYDADAEQRYDAHEYEIFARVTGKTLQCARLADHDAIEQASQSQLDALQ